MTDSPHQEQPAHNAVPGHAPAQPGHAPAVSSADLLRGGNELLIEHHGEFYRLRLTRSGKLILHK